MSTVLTWKIKRRSIFVYTYVYKDGYCTCTCSQKYSNASIWTQMERTYYVHCIKFFEILLVTRRNRRYYLSKIWNQYENRMHGHRSEPVWPYILGVEFPRICPHYLTPARFAVRAWKARGRSRRCEWDRIGRVQ